MCFRFKTKPTIFSHDVVGHVGGVEFGLCGVVDLVVVLECVCRITLNSKVNRHEGLTDYRHCGVCPTQEGYQAPRFKYKYDTDGHLRPHPCSPFFAAKPHYREILV